MRKLIVTYFENFNFHITSGNSISENLVTLSLVVSEKEGGHEKTEIGCISRSNENFTGVTKTRNGKRNGIEN